MDTHKLQGELEPERSIETEISSDLAGMSLEGLLSEMLLLKKKMLETGERAERDLEPDTDRERRLHDVYDTLYERGVPVSRKGELQPNKCKVSSVREKVEQFLAASGDLEQDIDQAA